MSQADVMSWERGESALFDNLTEQLGKGTITLMVRLFLLLAALVVWWFRNIFLFDFFTFAYNAKRKCLFLFYIHPPEGDGDALCQQFKFSSHLILNYLTVFWGNLDLC